MNAVEHSNKSILARACDPAMAHQAAHAIPPHIGNPEYIATTSDDEFIARLESRQWSVIFFAPGACRFSAANQPIPGGNNKTRGWTLERYRELVHETQGEQVPIVEALDEAETIGLLKNALAQARDTTTD